MEFQECDIMFSDENMNSSSSDQSNTLNAGYYSISTANSSSRNRNKMTMSRKKKKRSQEGDGDGQRSPSTPLTIPVSSSSSSSSSSPSASFRYNDLDCFGGGDEFLDENDEDQIVPPHVIVDRRTSGFNARKKNLIHFRNNILKLTGFLES
ncbi:hypothetical protein vseg_007357 [Gypsophila vaccaria]